MVTTQPQKTYFQGFNALRFYAALSVVIQHISYSPHDWFGVPLLPITLERFFLNGTDAVNLFFVLSGFLITYLLMMEHQRTGTVSIRNFYIRRAFRIYPVYFVYLFIVIVLLSPPFSPTLFFLLSFFMGNVAYVRFFPFPPLEHLWSIGVEEQYYLLAPVLARYKHRILAILLLIIGVWWTILLVSTFYPPSELTAFLTMSRYDFIAIGALMGYGYHQQWRWLHWLKHPAVRLGVGLAMVYAIIFTTYPLDIFYTTFMGLMFAILVYNIAAAPEPPALLKNRHLESLGNLSYSMYVYHPLFVLLFHKLFYTRLTLDQYQWIGYPLIVGLTLGASWLSYHWLESPLLRLKNRFRHADAAPARSGDKPVLA